MALPVDDPRAVWLMRESLWLAAEHRAWLHALYGTDCGYPVRTCHRVHPERPKCLLCGLDGAENTVVIVMQECV
jgi:hypothetical protein